MTQRITDRPTVTDFFCGGGGSTHGLTRAGWWGQVACNHDATAIATHKLNHPTARHIEESIARVDFRQLPTTTMLWASPSCVWHARSGGRARPPAEVELLRADPGSIDRATAFAVVEAAEIHRYPVVAMENVPEFADWTLYPWLLDGLERLRYTVHTLILDAADFGHAQHRRRWFAVCTQPGITVDLTSAPAEPVYAAAILDPTPGRLVDRPLYVSPQIEAITDPGVAHLVTYRRNARPRRADRHRLATVTAGGNHHAVATVDHDGRAWHRMLTNRECARAQGFSDAYTFVGTRAQVKRQIGNAVPVGIAEWIGGRAAAALGYSPESLGLAA